MTDSNLGPCPCCGCTDLDITTVTTDVTEDCPIAVCMACGFQMCAPNGRALHRIWNGAPQLHTEPGHRRPPPYQVAS